MFRIRVANRIWRYRARAENRVPYNPNAYVCLISRLRRRDGLVVCDVGQLRLIASQGRSLISFNSVPRTSSLSIPIMEFQ